MTEIFNKNPKENMRMNNLKQSFEILIAFFAFIFYTGCDSTEITDSTVSVMFTLSSITQKFSGDTIRLDTVKILLKDVKIMDQSGNDEVNIKSGPVVIYLNPDGITTHFAVNNIPPGNYDRISFQVHSLENSEIPPDQEFKEGSARYSVIVKGVFNSVPFVYKSKRSAEQDLKLETPIRVLNNSSANLTIIVDHPLGWFCNEGILMDPNNTDNENDINNNIEHAFKICFRDDDCDGKGS